MLQQAEKRRRRGGWDVELVHAEYGLIQPFAAESFDLILFSYCLSMIDPGWEAALDLAITDLAPGGRLVVLDFHHSPSRLFRRWMSFNHVRMEGQLLPLLREALPDHEAGTQSAFGGLWTRLTFVGCKPRPPAPSPSIG